MDLSNQSTLTSENTTRTIEYTPKGEIILRSRRPLSIPKKELELSRIQSFTRYNQLAIPPSHEILAMVRRNV